MRALVRGAVLVMALTPLVGGSLAAQQQKGDKEVQLFASSSFSTTGGASSTTGTIGLVFGFFATNAIEARVGVIGSGTKAGGTTTGVFALTPGVVYSFVRQGSKTIPYLGVDAYLAWVSSLGGTVRQNTVRPNGGFRYFMSRNAAFDFNVGYTSLAGTSTLDERIGLLVVF